MSIADQLLAIVPDSSKEIEVKGVKVKIKPIELTELARIVSRFPNSIDSIKGGIHNIDILPILKSGPAMISAVIATAIGCEGDLEEETKIS
ncbi:hypothetical protein, partial [Sulfitobacter sp. M22]|uniref:hypothetical protein n=1 Tax=Sulfitobacter sp. M22 TaxID=2675332 RepID=UPI001F31EA11